MNLTWHIVRKDFRQMAVPVAGWIGFVVVVTLGVICLPVPPAFDGERFSEVGRHSISGDAIQWVSYAGRFMMIAFTLQCCVAAVLAAYFSQRDPLVGSTSFWQTRPISSWRLFWAKMTGVLLLLVVVPTLVVAGLWWILGYSPAEIGSAALNFSSVQFIIVAAAAAIGSITSNLGMALFTSLAAVLVLAVTASLRGSTGGEAGKQLALNCILFLGPVLLLAVQFGGWKRRAGWYVFAGVLFLMCLTPYYVHPSLTRLALQIQRWSRTPGPNPADANISVVLSNADRPEGVPVMAATVSAPNSSAMLPMITQVRIGKVGSGREIDCRPAVNWGVDAAIEIVRNPTGALPEQSNVWRFQGALIRGSYVTGPQRASVKMAWAEPAILWTVPLRGGSSARGESDTVKLVAIRRDRVGVTVLLRELDPALGRWWPNNGPYDPVAQNAATVDCYVLKDTKSGVLAAVERHENGAIAFNGVMVSVRTLTIPEMIEPAKLKAWIEGKTLTKVRFKVRRAFIAELPEVTWDKPVSIGSALNQ